MAGLFIDLSYLYCYVTSLWPLTCESATLHRNHRVGVWSLNALLLLGLPNVPAMNQLTTKTVLENSQFESSIPPGLDALLTSALLNK